MSELLEKNAFPVPRTKPYNSKRSAMHSVVLALVIADIALRLRVGVCPAAAPQGVWPAKVHAE
jgi:hypothetical protein